MCECEHLSHQDKWVGFVVRDVFFFSARVQHVIRDLFVRRLRNGEPILSDMVSTIREVCRDAGWELYLGLDLPPNTPRSKWPSPQQDASEFLNFLMAQLEG